MLKRLTLTTIVLGIILAFGSLVFADIPNPTEQLIVGNANTTAKQKAAPGNYLPSEGLNRTPVRTQMQVPVKNIPSASAPNLPGCDFISYGDGATAFDFSWDLAGASQGEAAHLH